MKFAEVNSHRVSGKNVGRLSKVGALFDRSLDPIAKPVLGTGQEGKEITTEELLAIWTL
jgi:hypothetical protein